MISHSGIESDEDLDQDTLLLTPFNTIRDDFSDGEPCLFINEIYAAPGGFEADNGWVDIGLEAGFEYLGDGSGSENEPSDSRISSTKIIKSFCQIDSQGRLSFSPLRKRKSYQHQDSFKCRMVSS